MGDHESEVKGGDAERTFKLPNPVYFLPYQRYHRFEQGDDELQEILQVHGANYLSASDVGQRPLTPIAVWIVDVCSGSSMYVSGGFMPGCRLNKRCRPIRGGQSQKHVIVQLLARRPFVLIRSAFWTSGGAEWTGFVPR